jgi:hypothetical protein
MKYQCDNCSFQTDDADELDAVQDPMERLGPNPYVLLPAGQCPEKDCGSLVYDEDDLKVSRERDRKIEAHDDLLAALKVAQDECERSPSKTAQATLEVINAAIAKAEKADG